MNRVEQYLSRKLEERTLTGNLRELRTFRAPVDLFSNDYLGLATSGVLTKSVKNNFPGGIASGSTGSRLLSGNTAEAEALEAMIARFHKAEAALLFNSGYDANVGLISSIATRHTTILYDELCHASIIDGIRLAQCTDKFRFAHNGLTELEEKLSKYAGEDPVIVITESVFSMDGDLAPLTEMVALCERFGAQLIVDEAHATGVFGKHGEGLVCALGLEHRVFARVHTFGKALGCHGAAVVGNELTKRFLVNFARTFIYTTALPLHAIYTATAAYQYLQGDSFTNEPLHELITFFRMQAASSGIRGWTNSTSAIQALVIGDNTRTKHLATQLQAAGMQINPIMHPTVPPGMERLRICLHTFNTIEQIKDLFDKLRQ